MNLRLALLAAMFLAGCGTAVLEESSPKGSAHDASDAPKSGEAAKSAERGKATPDADDDKNSGEKESAHEEKEGEKEEAPKGHVTVRCAPAQKRTFSLTVDGLGRTEALPESLGALTATVEGHVHKLLAKLGDSVVAGQPILQLDTTVIETALAEKRANRDSLKATLVLLESLPRTEECAAAELAVKQGTVAIDRAQAIVDRWRPLVSKRDPEVSPQQFFDAEQALKQAKLQRETAEAQLKLLKLGPRPEAVNEAKAKIAIAERLIENTQATLGLHTIRAPISGVVDSLTCHPGQTLTVGTPVGEIVDTRSVYVTVYVPARSAQSIRVGLPVRMDLPGNEQPEPSASKRDELNGRVAFVGSIADLQTGNFPVRILVENGSGRLRLGQVIQAIVTLRKEESAIAVPEMALFDQGEGPLLAVVREGKIQFLHPELGISEGGFVAVGKTDLRDGEMVAIAGAYNVPEGTAATIEGASAAPAAGPAEASAKAGEHE